MNESPLPTDEPASPAEQANHLALHARPGHYDELRGMVQPVRVAASAQALAVPPAVAALRDAAAPPLPAAEPPVGADPPPLAAPWQQFFSVLDADGLADLPRRAALMERQVRDNGVTYNVYSDNGGPARPWSLDLFPFIVDPDSWKQVETGVLQRVRVLDRVMADVYGAQQLLHQGLLPPALVQGHPGYLRAMHGVQPPGGTWLHIAAFDLARGPGGKWWVVSQRTQAPSGLGYLLENRLAVSRQFPQAFEAMNVQRLAATYTALVDNLKARCAFGNPPHIVLLTPGRYSETYFEHAYLARYLGLTLAEGSDLTVRDQRLYLKTLNGLRPVHGVVKRLDDEFLDPLELRPDSSLGVPGLLQAVRAGHVLVANMPGSAFLESPALLGFLPALAQHLIGETLQLPALPTWWCGERAAMENALPLLSECVIKPTYIGCAERSFQTVLGSQLSRRELDEWAGRIARRGDEHTVQRYMPLSQMPTWQGDATGSTAGAGSIVPRAALLRVFAVSDGPNSWRVLPGGMARLAGSDAQIASMQRGGGSADVWVQTLGEVDRSSRFKPLSARASLERYRAPVTSRAAENMFWLGRYTERADNSVRLARLTLDQLSNDDANSPPLLAWLHQLALRNALVSDEVPSAPQSRRVFERTLIATMGDVKDQASVGSNLQSIRQAAAAVRERMSPDHWNVIEHAESDFLQCSADMAEEYGEARYSTAAAQRMLEHAARALAAMTGAQTDHMTRDSGWQLLSSGRHIERLGFLTYALASGFETGSVRSIDGFEAMLALFDSTITYHARYQQRRDAAALLDLLVLDEDNPRALAWVTRALAKRLHRLADTAPHGQGELSQLLPDPARWNLEALCAPGEQGLYPHLARLLEDSETAASEVSSAISARYFTHTFDASKSVGA